MNDICPICGFELLARNDNSQYPSFEWFNCPKCHKFYIDDSLFIDDSYSPLPMKLRSCLYYYFNEIELPRKNRFPFIVNSNKYSFDQKYKYVIHSDAIINLYPGNYEDQVSMILVNLLNLTEYPGEIIQFSDDLNIQAPLFLLDSKQGSNIKTQIEWWLSTLENEGYLTRDYKWEGELVYSRIHLNLKALLTASKYRKRKNVSKTCFIAMWFNPEVMKARKAIMEAVEDTGYIPIIIDMKEHNNQIVPEIIHEIQQSKFVIADFTGHRGGVYFEAGYAQGYGKEVIATCNKDFFNDMHFDLKQKNTIVWKDEIELKEKLIARIRATIGIENLN